MMPFWWACWIAWQTGTNNSSRWRGVRWCSSQYLVIGTPLTSSMTKKGRVGSKEENSALSLSTAYCSSVEHFRDIRVIHHGQRLPLSLEASDDLLRVHARFDDLQGNDS